MAKSIFRFLDNDSDPIADSVVIVLNGPLEDSPADRSSVLEPVAGNENGTRIFTDLPGGSYNLKFDTIVQNNLSPLYIAGPLSGITTDSVDTIHIVDAAVEADKIAIDAITNAKIATGAVSNAELASSAVSGPKIASLAVTGAKIAATTITKSKLAAEVFNDLMEDNAGWGPKIDGVTLAIDTSNQLYVADDGIGADQIAAAAVVEAKIGNLAVVGGKIGLLAVTTAKVANNAITDIKIGANAIKATHVSDGILEAANFSAAGLVDIRATAGYSPTGIAYVSPNFAGASAPYFDDLQAGIDYIVDTFSGDAGTVIVYPGTYNGPIDIDGSLSLVGTDRQRCLINWVPTIAEPAALKISAVGAEHILIQNLKVHCISDNDDACEAIGISANGISSKVILFDNIHVWSVGKSDASTPENGIGLDLIDSDVDINNSLIITEGGSHSGGGTGANAYSIRTETNDDVTLVTTRLKAIAGTGATSRGKSHGIYYVDTTSDVNVQSSIIDSEDEGLETASGSVDVAVVGSLLTVDVNISNVPKTKFVQTTASSYVKVKEVS